MISLQTFYDEHPINASEIIEKVEADGIAPDQIRPEHLSRHDQDHYGGTAATDMLVAALRIMPGMRVLDICSGLGGTSRYLAYRHGVSVHGIDLTESRVLGAQRLTEMVGLGDRVTFSVGDATRLDLGEARFDRAISQEAFLHIADRESLFAGCFRVLKPGGALGFTDWTATETLGPDARAFFAETFAAPKLVSLFDYVELMKGAGFVDVQATDLSAEWRGILVERLEMFRSLERETVARFGRERFDTYIRNYEFFVEAIGSGVLGGGRLIGWKR
ncbi:cyclopropane fatty-acyl-phospholipid synthase-like methyltransferase [Tepidamorphus gemmatus]|uniref:Cyclopropane fatty-acyl-phospholipid synthase-like methyltransferase n=1 Tax=Tepidamorphus gemmatus TaxID=747076 RepID=A0A4R3M0D5_9HYPH|nr:methyltransferase domain-containing protein [Tepidamorphus gemmatus]TCT04537.1 cyclopropane fatty-acyl-phospholipid synthase-like methyltransferase [Tepidamorphus gemmatus]